MSPADFESGARRLGSAIDPVFEAAFARLLLVFQTQDGMNNGHAVVERDLLERVRDGRREMLGMSGLAFEDHTERDDRVCTFLERDLAHDDRDFEGAGNEMKSDIGGRGQDAQLVGAMVDQPLHIVGVELARHEDEPALRANQPRPWRNKLRHR